MFFTATGIDTLYKNVLRDSLAFLPELILCVTVVLLLFLRLFRSTSRLHLGWLALASTVSCLVVSVMQWTGTGLASPTKFFEKAGGYDIYSGLLVYDNLTLFLRMFLFGFTALVVWLSLLTKIPDRDDAADFYTLLLGATLGMAMMASANHLLMVFIAVEMASVPSYVLAGFLKGRRQSSEAALKYVVYGGGASGIMLYGISLIAGKFGTGYLPDIAKAFAAVPLSEIDWVLILGGLFIVIGLGFKLAAFPFHFWCPDVFEGASAEVAGFLSVASKGAAVALLGRLSLMLAGFGSPHHALDWTNVVIMYLAPVLAIMAVLTVTFGNLAAYMQTNLKRLLAYSTIAHAGYMLMGLATMTTIGLQAVLIYLVAYLFMNQGAFGIVAFLRNETKSEDLKDFAGLVRRSPWLVVALGFCLLSLLGIPPLAGFVAKFQIFYALYDAGKTYATIDHMQWLSPLMWTVLVIGGINSVFSLFFYIKVLKVMVLDKPADETAPPIEESVGMKAYAGFMAAALVVLGISWGWLADAGKQAVKTFEATPVEQVKAVSGDK
jgi:NADH-quinone oxidoreductase subunit N